MSVDLVKQKIVWLDSDKMLEQCCESWSEKSLLAVDTEFMRSQTYYPAAGLIQVNDGESNFLIDPLKITDFTPFIDLMYDHEVLKVIHSCSEDLEVFQHTLGMIPENIFDTQIAAAMLGYGYSVGFANLVNVVLDESLPKEETRSDWLQRPLSQSQINYAALDVEYLFVLAKKLIDQLSKLDRVDWVLEDSLSLAGSCRENQDPKKSFRRVKTAWKLSPRQLYALQHLCEWRENIAQLRNMPRNHVIKEHSLFELAQSLPSHISQLRKYKGITERMIRADGEDMINITVAAKGVGEEVLPEALQKPLNGSEKDLLAKMKAHIAALAENLNIAPELMVKKKDYEFIIRGVAAGRSTLPVNLQGWRKDIVGEKLLEIARA